ncbi:hypothetical protein Tco_0661950 [Tanacetum coccineum]
MGALGSIMADRGVRLVFKEAPKVRMVYKTTSEGAFCLRFAYNRLGCDWLVFSWRRVQLVCLVCNIHQTGAAVLKVLWIEPSLWLCLVLKTPRGVFLVSLSAPRVYLVFQSGTQKGNTGSEKVALSLHKFPVVRFPNSHAKIFYIRKQQEPRKPKEEVYSNSKIVQIIKTYWELGHEHKFITEIVVRKANGCIMSFTDSNYKNLNKNDIKDMYLLIINHKVDDYAKTLLWSLSVFIRSTVIWERVYDFQLGVESYQQQVNLTTPTITFPGINKYKVFSIVSEPVYGIIYKNNKKEKRAMRHQEVHKFCDATLKRVLEGLKSYNNDIKYAYMTHNLSKEDVEYLQLFAEEIEE